MAHNSRIMQAVVVAALVVVMVLLRGGDAQGLIIVDLRCLGHVVWRTAVVYASQAASQHSLARIAAD